MPSGPRASPPTDVQHGHLLPLMWPAPWVPPSVYFGWWFSPWDLGGGVLVVTYCCSSYGAANPFTSSSPLTPPLGTPCSVQWMAVSIHLCICQALAKPLRRQLKQAPVSKHFLASTIVSGFGDCIWDGSPGGAVSGYLLHILSQYFLP